LPIGNMENQGAKSHDWVSHVVTGGGFVLIPCSLLDAETQYFVAESTKTSDLVDPNNHAPGDDIWMGCSSVSKAGKLCER
jgi:hypothetical protein